MDKSRRDQDACAKVLASKEDCWRDLHPADLLGHYWEAASWKVSVGIVIWSLVRHTEDGEGEDED